MSAINPVEQSLGDKNVSSEEPKEIVHFINMFSNKTVRVVRERLNDLLQSLLNGVLSIGGVDITVGAGAPGATTNGLVYLRTDGGTGTTLYVKEGTTWVGK
jgi:hypothetical protein